MDGGVLGLKDGEEALYAQAQKVAEQVLHRFDGVNLDASAWVQKMQNAVTRQSERFRTAGTEATQENEEPDLRNAYREQAEIIAEAVGHSLEGTEVKVGERTFGYLVREVK